MYKNIWVQFWHIFFTNLMIVFIYLELYTGTILITRLLTPSLQLQHPYYLPNSCTIFVFFYTYSTLSTNSTLHIHIGVELLYKKLQKKVQEY